MNINLISQILDVSPVMWVHVGVIMLIPILIVVGGIVYVAGRLAKRAKKKSENQNAQDKEENKG
ncbi:MAG: hypothetical protein R3Y32_08440 [Bacillota bacterium]